MKYITYLNFQYIKNMFGKFKNEFNSKNLQSLKCFSIYFYSKVWIEIWEFQIHNKFGAVVQRQRSQVRFFAEYEFQISDDAQLLFPRNFHTITSLQRTFFLCCIISNIII